MAKKKESDIGLVDEDANGPRLPTMEIEAVPELISFAKRHEDTKNLARATKDKLEKQNEEGYSLFEKFGELNRYFLLSSAKYDGPKAIRLEWRDQQYFTQYEEVSI